MKERGVDVKTFGGKTIEENGETFIIQNALPVPYS